MASSSAVQSLILFFIVVSLSIPGPEIASAAGNNRKLLAPIFPGIPGLEPLPTFPDPTIFPPLFPTPNTDPSAQPILPDFPIIPGNNPLVFPTNPFIPVFPPQITATTP
ncbi:hypothetical protein ABFS83_14G098800 [Erythranthe nasuta]